MEVKFAPKHDRTWFYRYDRTVSVVMFCLIIVFCREVRPGVPSARVDLDLADKDTIYKGQSNKAKSFVQLRAFEKVMSHTLPLVVTTMESEVRTQQKKRETAEEYGPFFREWLAHGAALTAADHAHFHHLRLACNGDLQALMRDIDVLACPSTPRVAFPVTPEFLYGPIPPGRDPWHARYTAPFNFSGLPTISLPCGLSDAGLPFSVQFAGLAMREDVLVGVGHAFEQATGWHALHPPVA